MGRDALFEPTMNWLLFCFKHLLSLFATSAEHGLPQLPGHWQGKRAQRGHNPKPLRPQTGVERAGDNNEQCGRYSDADGTVDRLGRPFEAFRHYLCHQTHGGEMKQRKGDTMQRLYQSKRHNISCLRHHGPAQHASQCRDGGRAGRSQPRHERRANDKEHEHLCGDRL